MEERHAITPSDDDLRHDALTRQLLAIRRAEREGEALGDELQLRRDEVARHQRDVVGKLEAAGYLSAVGLTRAKLVGHLFHRPLHLG